MNKSETVIEYKGFEIHYPDNYYGFSLYKNDEFCQSAADINTLKITVECILLWNEDLTYDEYWELRKNIKIL